MPAIGRLLQSAFSFPSAIKFPFAESSSLHPVLSAAPDDCDWFKEIHFFPQ